MKLYSYAGAALAMAVAHPDTMRTTMDRKEITQEERSKLVLGALIAWIAQSSAGVLSVHEAAQLINLLEGNTHPDSIGLCF